MRKTIGKNISKISSSKYCPGILATRQKPLYHPIKSATEALKTDSKGTMQKNSGGNW